MPAGHAIRRLETAGKPVAAAIAGLVDEVVVDGAEVMAAEAWLLSDAARSVQPWDRPDAAPLAHAALAPAIERHRARELSRMLGHEPAPLAILDCVELGMMQPIDGAIRSEMAVFARLIQRPEPRNMIRTLFLGKQAYDKARRDGNLALAVTAAAEAVATIVNAAVAACPDLRLAGFASGSSGADPVQARPDLAAARQGAAAIGRTTQINPSTRAMAVVTSTLFGL